MIKFTVKPGGSFDNGIGTSNKIGNDRTIVPVTIIGDHDGIWDKNAWKEAFNGNSVTGFIALPRCPVFTGFALHVRRRYLAPLKLFA